MSGLFKPVNQQPQSLLASPAIKNSTIIKVYFQHQSNYLKVSIEAEGLTTNAVICKAIDKLNQNKQLSLVRDPYQYQLFAAKKDGSKDNGLPALELNQLILKTQIKRFHLIPMLKVQSLYIPNPNKDNISTIKSQINFKNVNKKPIVNNTQETTKKPFSFYGLFCLQK